MRRFNKDELVVLIKPSNESSLKNVIDCMDEMVINNVYTYMIVEPESNELRKLP